MSTRRALAAGLVGVPGAFALLVAVEAWIAWGAERPSFADPSREPVALGTGPPLTYVVMGDSTGAGQGAAYEHGIAMATARHLARTHAVELTNLAESGATLADVLRSQVEPAAALRPDVVLLAAGANDVTHLTSRHGLRADLTAVAGRLRAARRDTRIVLTAAPDMGSVPRLAQPLRALAGGRTRQLNRVFDAVARAHELTTAPIARETGSSMREDPSRFAADRYHPDERGYALWIPVLTRALDDALVETRLRGLAH